MNNFFSDSAIFDEVTASVRRRMFHLLTSLCILLSIVYIVHHSMEGNKIHLLSFSVLLVLSVFLEWQHMQKTDPEKIYLAFSFLCMFIELGIVYGGKSRLYFQLLLIILFFLFLGRRRGLLMNGIFFVCLVILFFAPQWIGSHVYEAQQRFRFFLAAISFFMVGLIYEDTMHQLHLALYQKTEKLKEASRVDPLTGIANRRSFDQSFRNKLTDSPTRLVCFIVFDIDHFKAVNDQYGHSVGDEILSGLTNRVKSQIRKGDLFARWGGEEFVLLLLDIDEDAAIAIAEKIRASVDEKSFETSAGSQHITISLGVYVGTTEISLEEMFQIADSGMYQAKDRGRNNAVLATEKLPRPGDFRNSS